MSYSTKDGTGATVLIKDVTEGADKIIVHHVEGPYLGILTETAPATDTASSGINGRMQRLAQRITSLIAQIPATLGMKTAAASLAVTLASDDVSVPKLTAIQAAVESTTPKIVLGSTIVFDVTLSTDTAIYASGDVLADSQVMTDIMRANDATGILQSLVLLDQADQKVAMTLYFLSANVPMGTENAAPSISDANALNILGHVDIATTDWKDLGGVASACLTAISLGLKPATGTRNVYIAAVNSTGTPTFAAGSLTARLTVLRD